MTSNAGEAGGVRPGADPLAWMARALSATVRPGDVLDVVADAVGSLVGECSLNISLLDDGGRTLSTVMSRRTSPQVRMQFAAFPADAPYPTRDALRSRRPVVVQGLADRDRRYPALAAVPVSQVAWVVLPLVVDDRPLGTLSLGWTTPQPFDAAQLQLCEGIADVTAAALARAQMFDREEQARTAAEDLATRLQVLQDLTGQLSEATDLAAVGDLVVGAGLQALAADAAAIGLLDDDGRSVTTLASAGLPADLLPRWSRHDVGVSGQVADLRESLRPVMIASRADRDARFADRDPRPEDDLFEATATLPLVTAGALVGVVAYAWRHPRTFDAHDQGYLTAIAAHAATAIDRSRLLERTRQIAETLQRALLPEAVSDVEGWDLATCYVPAVQDTQVGGDWYDAFATDDGRLVLVLGDVAGKGVRAAAVMGAVRSALRAYATLDADPATVLRRLDTYFGAFKDDEMVTVAVALLDPRTGEVTYACAGHLPPLLVSGTSVEWLDAATSPPLGANRGGDRPQTTTRVAPGQALLLYSDGLVERRHESLGRSLGTLADRAGTLSSAPDLTAAARALIRTMDAPDKVVDDTALLVVRRHPG
ncbi:GAF domain-containing SpoIIE family protein phosphatase [Kineosporia sp. A_224]|uniref:GAF domain-containing SpoIIE family protein phosphatase n=1 Tax=Kineosporia sp. A_224 TaxID=1962180 RepID=UPI000B4AB277|nr:GAF domain-containing SpoIIE family protein phosphatase [Kineosporia sp. A_224]